MNKIPFVDLKAQYSEIKEEVNIAINNILDNTSFIMGKPVEEFENAFAAYCNAKNCIGVSSGTSALYIALKAIGIKEGDEVIVPSHTFIATAEAALELNAKVIFAEVDKETFTIDPNSIKEKITNNTKAIIPVHLYGQPCNMDPIIEIAKEHNLTIIEDCAQSHGAEYKGKKVPISTVGCFSFYPGKNLGAYGDAGAIVTNDEEIAEKARMLINHGRKKGDKYIHTILGTNHRIDALQAAILNVKLKHIDSWNEKRRNNAKIYNNLLKDTLPIPKEEEYAKHVYHLYVIKAKNRDKLRDFLKEKGISSGIHYPIPLHLQPALKDTENNLNITEDICKNIVSLPMFPELTEEQINYIAETIKEGIKNDI
jgi:dTDP-4-amino-4,6-dideoxygalactose transaminase